MACRTSRREQIEATLAHLRMCRMEAGSADHQGIADTARYERAFERIVQEAQAWADPGWSRWAGGVNAQLGPPSPWPWSAQLEAVLIEWLYRMVDSSIRHEWQGEQLIFTLGGGHRGVCHLSRRQAQNGSVFDSIVDGEFNYLLCLSVSAQDARGLWLESRDVLQRAEQSLLRGGPHQRVIGMRTDGRVRAMLGFEQELAGAESAWLRHKGGSLRELAHAIFESP